MDYKIVVSIIQLIGYVCAKLIGIKFISELKSGNRLKFIIGSAALSEVSLLMFGVLPECPTTSLPCSSTVCRSGVCGA